MRAQPAPGLAIAALAERQGGVVGYGQLTRLGLSRPGIGRRVGSGQLHIVHRGVYAVGHRVLGRDGRWWAALLAAGPYAVLSHTSAAAAWDLVRSDGGTVHVTVPGHSGRGRRSGVRVHRTMVLRADDSTTRDGMPITTPLRTVIDLAAEGLRGRRLEAALDRAELLRLLDFADLQRRLEDRRGRPGSRALLTTLSLYTAGMFVTRSELEEAFLSLCDEHGLPRPNVNCVIDGDEVDFHWPGARVIVEVDGYGWHRSPSAMDDDRDRDVRLGEAGWRVLRFTYRQVKDRPAWVARAVRRALYARGAL
jgi:hypothetical protein